MTPYTILGRLRLLTELDDEAARAALPFCEAAMEQLLAGLDKKSDRKDPRLTQAGAAIAFCMLLLQEDSAKGEDGIASFKAGDITVTKKETPRKDIMAKAERLKAEALEDIRPLMRDTGFYARSMPLRKIKQKRGKANGNG